jgi:hypothetical protein
LMDVRRTTSSRAQRGRMSGPGDAGRVGRGLVVMLEELILRLGLGWGVMVLVLTWLGAVVQVRVVVLLVLLLLRRDVRRWGRGCSATATVAVTVTVVISSARGRATRRRGRRRRRRRPSEDDALDDLASRPPLAGGLGLWMWLQVDSYGGRMHEVVDRVVGLLLGRKQVRGVCRQDGTVARRGGTAVGIVLVLTLVLVLLLVRVLGPRLLAVVATTLVRAQTKPNVPLELLVCLAELAVVRMMMCGLLVRTRVAHSSIVIALGVRELLLRQLVLLLLLELALDK